MAAPALELFHPRIRSWFTDAVGEPTEVQALAWPRIAAGEHVLITAPTGSGKTLTAFLWALQQLLTRAWPGGQVRVLYVSPLRALNTDIRRNLARPLAELEERFRAAGEELPAVRVLTRSGDTPAAERRRMVRQPPEILITTPESLNILLTSQGGRALLTGLATVILDEIHAVAASKRGTHLITAVDRLVPLSGEFQRIALSATIKPLETIADLIAGYELDEPLHYRKRPVTIVRAPAAKRYELGVRFPAAAGAELEESHWDRLARDFKQRIRRNRSTLVFANSRRVTEKVTRLINAGEAADLAYSHHGSLSREVRAVVERRLKQGELEAIVATSSLELGIDVGALDEVILVETPRAISSTIQRLGRAGHGVGEVSRGRIYPTHGRDLLNAAIAVRSVLDQDIEAVRPIAAPLDVLAQVLLSMTVAESWDLDQLYARVRTSAPFHDLKRRQFDLVIDMLAGRFADSRIRELRPRVAIDRIRNTVRARPGVARLLYMAGGTIPDRGYFALRLQESMAKIGELDEEFVWERSIGDTFTLGTQGWRIRKITHNDVLVAPSRGATAMAPFWRADVQDRDFHFSEKVAQFLARADRLLGKPKFIEGLADDYHLEGEAAAELVSFLKAQKSATGKLPHRHHLLIEHVRDLGRDDDRRQVILHTFWGGRVNRPLAIALRAAWEERYPDPIEVLHDDDSILLLLPAAFAADDLLSLVDPEHVEELLRHRLEQTGFFGARFRTNASTALLLPKSGFRHRMPLWLNRQRSKKLLEAVSRYGDFPILVETWRTCLVDEFDLDHLLQLLREVRDGKIALSEVVTESASPFAAGLIWQQTNQYMYDDDTPTSARASNLRPDLLRELVFSSQLRPRLPAALVEQFRRKVQRTSPGYAPRDADELAEWLVERLLLPLEEWRELLAAVERDGGEPQEELLRGLEERALAVTLPGADAVAIAAVDRLPRILRALALAPGDIVSGGLVDAQRPPPPAAREGLETLWAKASPTAADSDEAPADPLADLVGEWLRFYGPLAPERLHRVFGLDADRLREVLALLQESQQVVIDQLTRGAPDAELEVCDVENLEILLRWLRRESRPSFQALGAEYLPLFLAIHQGLVRRGECLEDLRERLDRLLGYPLPAAAWEAEILPARLSPYYPSWLDSLMQETDLLWFGCGKTRLSFAFPADLELFQGHGAAAGESVAAAGESVAAAGESAAALAKIFPRDRGKFELGELVEHAGLSTAELTPELWQLAWEGRISNDSFVAVRKGVESKFQAAALAPPRPGRRRPGRRRGFDRWQATRPFYGSWFAIEREAIPPDALEQEELVKDRLRVLLDRYGVLFRELVARELPLMQWSRLFRTLRLMELSGEILAGHFFAGVRGLQFISHAAYRELERGLPEDGIYWMNALDPASLCGIEIEGLKAQLPARQASTHLVFHGPRLVMVSRRRGRDLDFRVDAEHPHLAEYLEVLKVLLTREFQPLKFIDVETINGEPAPRSPYGAKLGEVFRTVREQRSVKLWKHY